MTHTTNVVACNMATFPQSTLSHQFSDRDDDTYFSERGPILTLRDKANLGLDKNCYLRIGAKWSGVLFCTTEGIATLMSNGVDGADQSVEDFAEIFGIDGLVFQSADQRMRIYLLNDLQCDDRQTTKLGPGLWLQCQGRINLSGHSLIARNLNGMPTPPEILHRIRQGKWPEKTEPLDDGPNISATKTWAKLVVASEHDELDWIVRDERHGGDYSPLMAERAMIAAEVMKAKQDISIIRSSGL